MEDFEVKQNEFFFKEPPKITLGILTSIQAGLCNDAETNMMGEPIDATKKGTFYLDTNAQAPYAMPFKSASTTTTIPSSMLLCCIVFASFLNS